MNRGMLHNPIVQTIMLFISAYSALTFLERFPPLDSLLTIFCGLFAATIWMLRHNRTKLYSLYDNSIAKAWIDFVAKAAKEQAPVDPSLDETPVPTEPGKTEERGRLRLRTDQDFQAAARQIRDCVKGHDDVVDALIDQVRRNIQLREGSVKQASFPPLGVFLLVGKSGLGKKTLATELASRVYKGGGIAVLNAAEAGVHAGILIAEAKTNAYTTFIIDNFNGAPAQFQSELLSIISGAPQVDYETGAKVSFRHCFFFLLLHRDAGALPRPQRGGIGTGETVVMDALMSSVNMDKRLAWSVHGTYPFVLPPPLDQAAVVAQIMEGECRKYNIGLGYVNAAILAREVQVTSMYEGFEITPSRVSKLMHDRILAAIAANEQLVDLGSMESAQAQHSANYA